MWRPLTMFTEKKEPGDVSMTRVIGFIFALTYCGVLVANAANAHSIGWPFCTLGVVTLLVVPIQSLFHKIQTWAMTPNGKAITHVLMSKAVALIPAIGGIPGTTTEIKKSESSTTTVPAEPEPIDHGAST